MDGGVSLYFSIISLLFIFSISLSAYAVSLAQFEAAALGHAALQSETK